LIIAQEVTMQILMDIFKVVQDLMGVMGGTTGTGS